MKVNSMAFTPEEVKKGLHLKLLECLMDLNNNYEDGDREEILITSDGYCTIIQWYHYMPEFENKPFQFIEQDEVIMKEKLMPDNSIMYFQTVEEYKKYLMEHYDERKNS